jgi:hypothetical protein
MFRRLTVLTLLSALIVPATAGKKPKGAPLVRLPDQHAEVAHLTLAKPAQQCENWAWAVGLEAILEAQQVSLKQTFWVQKANGGELCIDAPPGLARLANVVDGQYVLDDGRKIRLQSRYLVGAPTIPDDIIAPIRQGVPIVLFWKWRALVVRSVVYDEYIYPNGQRMFEIREMRLLDPLVPAKEREVSFVNGRDDPADISGVFQVTVIPDQAVRW